MAGSKSRDVGCGGGWGREVLGERGAGLGQQDGGRRGDGVGRRAARCEDQELVLRAYPRSQVVGISGQQS